jgi:acyl-coenzyme A synthetase/AMP-(fatty) acid ligase
MPREVKFVPALPTTSSGKIMRRQLKTLDQDAHIEAGKDSARQRVGAA